MLNTNTQTVAKLTARIAAQDADVIIVGERAALDPLPELSQSAYPYQLKCPSGPCDVILMSRCPLCPPAQDMSSHYHGALNHTAPSP